MICSDVPDALLICVPVLPCNRYSAITVRCLWPFARLFNSYRQISRRLANDMPGGVIPDQQASGLVLDLQPCATLLQKLGGQSTHRTTCDAAKRHLTTSGLALRSLLPQDTITGQGFGIRISFLPRLFHQARLPAPPLARSCKATPPHLVHKPNRPGGLLAIPSDQPVACVFRRCWGPGLVIPCLARFQLVLSRLRARRRLSSVYTPPDDAEKKSRPQCSVVSSPSFQRRLPCFL